MNANQTNHALHNYIKALFYNRAGGSDADPRRRLNGHRTVGSMRPAASSCRSALPARAATGGEIQYQPVVCADVKMCPQHDIGSRSLRSSSGSNNVRILLLMVLAAGPFVT